MAVATGSEAGNPRPVSLRQLLRVRSFIVLYAAEAQSILGDQLARVALTVLVFQRTGSAAATALTYAATMLPQILGGGLLARLGDRFSRRAVMIGCDLLRAVAIGSMAVPGLPLGAMIGLLVVAVFIGPAFSASQVSYLSTSLDAEQFRAATGLRMFSSQVAQVLGFAVGGVVVAATSARAALVIDSATFLVSAGLILGGLGFDLDRKSPPPAAPSAPDGRRSSVWLLWRLPQVRLMGLLSLLAGFFVVPEGLAVPFGNESGASTAEVGLLLASIPLGGALGAVAVVKLVRTRRRIPVACTMAVACGLPLAVSATDVPWWAAGLAWLVSGAFAAYQLEIVPVFVRALPEYARSHLMGVFGSLLVGVQGIGLALFGLVARTTGPGWAIAAAGLVGSLGAVLVAIRLRAIPSAGPVHDLQTPDGDDRSPTRDLEAATAKLSA